MRHGSLRNVQGVSFGHEFRTCSECQSSAKSTFATSHGPCHETHVNVTRQKNQSRDRLLQHLRTPRQQSRRYVALFEREHANKNYIEIGSSDMEGKLPNHYEVLDLPIYATRHQIRKAHHQRLSELEDARRSVALSPRGSDKPLIEHFPVVAASDSLRVFLPDEVLKSWHSIDAVVATRRIPAPQVEEKWRHVRQTPQAIARRNELDDAYYILGHPVKKKAYDMEHEQHLKPYEGRRHKVRVCGQASKATAVRQAKNWLESLQHGHEKGTKFVEMRFNRVEDMKLYGRYDKGTIASSMMCGEAVAAFVDTMEL